MSKTAIAKNIGEYIKTSIAFKEQEQRENEKRIQQKLKQQKEATRKAKIAAQQEKKARKFAQRGIIVSLVLTSIALGSGLLANQSKVECSWNSGQEKLETNDF